jgi:hypothetical protein
MRKTTLLAMAAAAIGGFCLASATTFGATQYNIWQTYGEEFQLGYIVGYLDAVRLSQLKDRRVMMLTSSGKTDYNRWLREVNAYFADPANTKRTVPDAMAFVGNKVRTEWLQEWTRRMEAKPSPSASPGS